MSLAVRLNVTDSHPQSAPTPHLSVFELGFAGKGRIYYTRGKQRRFRVLTIGAKNTQKSNLDYLRKLTL